MLVPKNVRLGPGLENSSWRPSSLIMYSETHFFTALSQSKKPSGAVCSGSLEISVGTASCCSSYHFLFSRAFVPGGALVTVTVQPGPLPTFPCSFCCFPVSEQGLCQGWFCKEDIWISEDAFLDKGGLQWWLNCPSSWPRLGLVMA